MEVFDLKNKQEYLYEVMELEYLEWANDVTDDKENRMNNNKPVLFSDKNEIGHYDLLSALQKSIRGSDVNASLHYLARLIMQEDLDSIYRRMTVIAYEDIGLANPNMGVRVDACVRACELIGLPEARIPLGQMVIDLCLSPKSNSAYMALDEAINDINKGNTGNPCRNDAQPET